MYRLLNAEIHIKVKGVRAETQSKVRLSTAQQINHTQRVLRIMCVPRCQLMVGHVHAVCVFIYMCVCVTQTHARM